MTNHCLLLTVTAMADILLTTTSANRPRTILNAYKMVEKYGFLQGIIPRGVLSNEIRDGYFEVHFSGDCNLRMDSFSLTIAPGLPGTSKTG
jgi:hypothetical protein